MTSIQKTVALVAGIILVLLGIAGFISNPLIGEQGYLQTNMIQNILHLVAGAYGIYGGTKGEGRGFNATLGWIGIILGVLAFIPVIDDLLANLLGINAPLAVLYLVAGILLLLIYYFIKE